MIGYVLYSIIDGNLNYLKFFQFRYRSQRVEVSLNTFEIAPSNSTLMLVKLLGEAITETDICK